MRRRIMAGNWKMYKTAAETATFFEQFNPLVEDWAKCDIVICPPFVNIPTAVQAANESPVQIGAQNLFWIKEGAYTGEVSGEMLGTLGCRWVLVGHSERRQHFGETDAQVLKKAQAAIDAGLRPIICIGETLDDHRAGRTEQVLVEHFAGGVAGLMEEQFEQVALAYEPVWAIGTGQTATPEIAAAAHRVLRREAGCRFGEAAGERLQILYGGSVKADNIQGLMAQPELDGVLVGGASLDPRSFATIVRAA